MPDVAALGGIVGPDHGRAVGAATLKGRPVEPGLLGVPGHGWQGFADVRVCRLIEGRNERKSGSEARPSAGQEICTSAGADRRLDVKERKARGEGGGGSAEERGVGRKITLSIIARTLPPFETGDRDESENFKVLLFASDHGGRRI